MNTAQAISGPRLVSRKKRADHAFISYVALVREDVDAALARFFQVKTAIANGMGRAPAVAIAAAAKLTMRGGKRQRAALLAAAYEACGGHGPSPVVMAGVSLELLQTYFLVQDDWMDASDTRRGGPSVHVALEPMFGSRHEAAAAAVLAADHACALSQEAMLSLPGLPPECVLAAVRELARIQQDVVCGQLLDMDVSLSDGELDRMHELKTGSYTVRGPFEIGALLAGATTEQHDALERLARPIGIAFQLRDDLLGTFGAPGTTGKSSEDVGKRTALTIELAQGRRGAEALATRDPEIIRAAMIESGARARVEARLAGFVEEALELLAAAPLTVRGKELLASAIVALAWRKR